MRQHRQARPLSGHEAPKDKDILDAIERMGRLARSQVSQAKQAFVGRNTGLAQDLVRQDAEINRLNRAIFNRAVEIGDDLELREWAMFMILVARVIWSGSATTPSTSPSRPYSSSPACSASSPTPRKRRRRPIRGPTGPPPTGPARAVRTGPHTTNQISSQTARSLSGRPTTSQACIVC